MANPLLTTIHSSVAQWATVPPEQERNREEVAQEKTLSPRSQGGEPQPQVRPVGIATPVLSRLLPGTR